MVEDAFPIGGFIMPPDWQRVDMLLNALFERCHGDESRFVPFLIDEMRVLIEARVAQVDQTIRYTDAQDGFGPLLRHMETQRGQLSWLAGSLMAASMGLPVKPYCDWIQGGPDG